MFFTTTQSGYVVSFPLLKHRVFEFTNPKNPNFRRPFEISSVDYVNLILYIRYIDNHLHDVVKIQDFNTSAEELLN